MSQHQASIIWQRQNQSFTDGKYSRAHEWHFDGGLCIPASAAPSIVPLPFSIPENIDPEEAFIAAIASCHMLFFLSFAAKAGLIVEEYRDNPVGFLEHDENRKRSITRVVLQPEIRFSNEPPQIQIEKLHQQSHEVCFIANSIKSHIEIKMNGNPIPEL